ncbi:MAG: hypothetical protein JWP47_1160 [Polaromonas sp.]|nr:hypothetical protein [Polaromonas sp.]
MLLVASVFHAGEHEAVARLIGSRTNLPSRRGSYACLLRHPLKVRMLKYAGSYLAVWLTLLLVDMLWLRVIAVSWYEQGMGPLLAASPNLWAAAAFYLIYPLGLLIFAVYLPDAGKASVLKVAGFGLLFGFFAYATYDLTGLAVIRNWPLGLSLLDMAWGACVSAVAAAAGKLSLDYLSR